MVMSAGNCSGFTILLTWLVDGCSPQWTEL